MDKPHNSKSMAGGVFIGIGLVVGGIAGIYYNEPSAGMVIGLGLGSVAALVVWLIDRKRGN